MPPKAAAGAPASRLDKARQRVLAAEGAGAPAEKRKRSESEEARDAPPMSEAEQEAAFAQMLYQQNTIVSTWRLGFYMLPVSVALLAGFMLYRHTQKPWEEEAAHFVPLKQHDVSAGAVAFGLAMTILTCVLSAAGNALPKLKALQYMAGTLSIAPFSIFIKPFVSHPGPMLGKFYILLWLPLSAPVVVIVQLLVEALWAKMEGDLQEFWRGYRAAQANNNKGKGKAA